jgi:hypothetical protein
VSQMLNSTSNVDIAELPEREAERLDAIDEANRLAEVKRLQEEAGRLARLDDDAYVAEGKLHEKSEATALECGRAFLALMAKMHHGEFTDWYRSKVGKKHRNRINYCIRLARIDAGLACRATELVPYRVAIKQLHTNIRWLYGFAQDGDSANALKLLATLNADLWKFYEANFLHGGRKNWLGKKLKKKMPPDLQIEGETPTPEQAKAFYAAAQAAIVEAIN